MSGDFFEEELAKMPPQERLLAEERLKTIFDIFLKADLRVLAEELPKLRQQMRKEKSPAMENEQHHRVNKITAEVLINHFTKIQPELDFERHFAGWTQRASHLLAPQYQILHAIVDSPPESNVSDQQYGAACILWKALNTTVSAIELARKGYVTEPLILLRHVLECVCTALDVHRNPETLKAIYSQKYESTKAIGPAKRIVPVIGPFYGLLSDAMAHVGIMATAPQWVAQHKQGPVRGVLVGGGFDDTRLWQFEIALHQIELGINVLSVVVEYIFFEALSDHMYWKTDGKRLHYAPSEAVILRAAQVMERLRKQFGALDAENPLRARRRRETPVQGGAEGPGEIPGA